MDCAFHKNNLQLLSVYTQANACIIRSTFIKHIQKQSISAYTLMPNAIVWWHLNMYILI